MSAIRVRPAGISDADAVWELVQEFAASFTPTRSGFGPTFAEVLRDDEMLVAVAEDESVIVGYVFANRHPTFFADASVVWVEELMVDPVRRRSGVGRELMNAVEAWALASSSAYVSLATRRAADFYAAIGYEQSAVFFRKPMV